MQTATVTEHASPLIERGGVDAVVTGRPSPRMPAHVPGRGSEPR
ncbi:hypothetical protein [Nocardia beijingensis]|uniref:Uncharacterized protein n=1 Tax=Nocardia beijingensis TaxID=95162 RepID=A0ABW7WEQ8_9NOCA